MTSASDAVTGSDPGNDPELIVARGGPSEPVEALIARGAQALHEAGDLRTSRRWFEEACRAAEEVGDSRALAEAAIGLGGIWVHEHRNAATRARVQSWQSRAMAVSTVGSDAHLLLRARMAAETDYLNGRHDSVLAMLEEARQREDPRLLASVLSMTHHCLLGPAHAGLRADLAQELLRTASHTGRRADRLMGLLWRSVDLLMAGDPHAQRSLGQLSAELAEGDHLAVSFALQAIQVMLATRAGDFDRAEQMAGECVAAGEIAGDADAAGWYSGQIMAIRWFQGRITELLPTLTGQVHAPDLSVIDDSLIAALAVATATNGDRREAASALARLGHGDLTELSRSSIWLVTLYGAVEAAALLADRDTATTAYALLKPFAQLPMTVSLAVTCFGSVEQALGVASLTTGHQERAISHLQRAVRANLALEHWPATCLSRHRLAQALDQRNGPGDGVEAARERALAEREAAEFGMVLPPEPSWSTGGQTDGEAMGSTAGSAGGPANDAGNGSAGGPASGWSANGNQATKGEVRPNGQPVRQEEPSNQGTKSSRLISADRWTVAETGSSADEVRTKIGTDVGLDGPGGPGSGGSGGPGGAGLDGPGSGGPDGPGGLGGPGADDPGPDDPERRDDEATRFGDPASRSLDVAGSGDQSSRPEDLSSRLVDRVARPDDPANRPGDQVNRPGGQVDRLGEPAGAQISLLGPLEVRVDGVMRPVLGHRRRTVLAVLALHAGEIVSVDRLIDVVWGDRPPRTAINTLQSHVSYLRRVIGDKAGIVARPPGYLLDLGGDLTDVATAERLIQVGTRLADLPRRVEHLRAALALWRGRPLVDVSASTWLDQQAERLNHLLLQAHQTLAEARLALGENALLAMELQPLIREHPLAERLHAHLMLALYREGRQSEALEVYRRLRSLLSAELGVEPTEPLRQLQLAILRQDADL
jgi:DNA-binding SARP family transcriptional activator